MKAHHPAAFVCALLNNWPMGFYHPSTLITDAVRHGAVVRPIDVTCSGWLCDLEDQGRAVRIGLRYVAGLREALGKRIEAERLRAPFGSLGDFAARTGAGSSELATLADIGAFASLGGTRREALWQAEAIDPLGALFGGTTPDASGTLPEMTMDEAMAADYAGTGLSTGPHPIAFAREALDKQGVTRAAALRELPNGHRARVAGVVIVRQRPGTAKGFVFITVEDETGFANAIVTPQRFLAHRRAIVGAHALVIEGVVQNQQGVVSIKADRFAPLTGRAGAIDVSHDFH